MNKVSDDRLKKLLKGYTTEYMEQNNMLFNEYISHHKRDVMYALKELQSRRKQNKALLEDGERLFKLLETLHGSIMETFDVDDQKYCDGLDQHKALKERIDSE